MVRDESQPAAAVAGRVVWDEQNLAENERIKATIVTGKINEPKTPWQELMPDDGIDVPGEDNATRKTGRNSFLGAAKAFPDWADFSLPPCMDFPPAMHVLLLPNPPGSPAPPFPPHA